MENKKETYATSGSAGLDLLAKESGVLKAKGYCSINVGKKKIPEGCVGFVMPKSGLAKKYNVVVRLGVIDSDYTGDIIVTLDNFGSVDFDFQKGMKVAQLVVVPFIHLKEFQVEQTIRGDNGFGSTGA